MGGARAPRANEGCVDARDIYREQIDDMVTMLTNQVSEVDDETLAKRPGGFQNPVGFI